MKTNVGVDEQIHAFLTSALDEWSASRPVRFTPGEITPGTHWVGSRVGQRTGLDDVERKKNLGHTGTRTPLYRIGNAAIYF
jgi:hypothetical protein